MQDATEYNIQQKSSTHSRSAIVIGNFSVHSVQLSILPKQKRKDLSVQPHLFVQPIPSLMQLNGTQIERQHNFALLNNTNDPSTDDMIWRICNHAPRLLHKTPSYQPCYECYVCARAHCRIHNKIQQLLFRRSVFCVVHTKIQHTKSTHKKVFFFREGWSGCVFGSSIFSLSYIEHECRNSFIRRKRVRASERQSMHVPFQ